MKFYMRRLRPGNFVDGLIDGPDSGKAFHVFAWCQTVHPHFCEVFSNIRSMEDKDANAAFNGLRHLCKVAETGQPLEVHYDEKQCHVAVKFKLQPHDKSEVDIWRVRNGAARIYFIYGADRKIIVLMGDTKRTATITKAERSQLTHIATFYLDAVKTNNVEIFVRGIT